MLLIQKYLRKFQGSKQALEQLEKDFAIRSKVSGNLVSLNYTQGESPKNEEICKECRGLILELDTWNVVAYPFRRFFNIQEGEADKIDLSNSTVLFDKADGSLISAYIYDGELNFATRGCAFAEGNLNQNPDKSFNDLANEAIDKNFCNVSKLWEYAERYTLILELISPENRVVTPYDTTELRLLGARDKNQCEVGLAILNQISIDTKIPMPKIYDITDKADLLEMAKNLPQMQEGYVLVDYGKQTNGSYHRVKIKNPKWLAIHNLVGNNFCEKRALELCQTGENQEFLAYFPEYKELFAKVGNFLKTLDNRLENDYNSIQHLRENRKNFALEAVKMTIPAYLFQRLDGKVKNAREFIGKMMIDKLLEIFDKG